MTACLVCEYNGLLLLAAQYVSIFRRVANEGFGEILL